LLAIGVIVLAGILSAMVFTLFAVPVAYRLLDRNLASIAKGIKKIKIQGECWYLFALKFFYIVYLCHGFLPNWE
jgi:hypothetical protein